VYVSIHSKADKVWLLLRSCGFLLFVYYNLHCTVAYVTCSELDGIVGWLVYFGRLYVGKGMDALDEVKALGVRMVKSELDEVFTRSPYYNTL